MIFKNLLILVFTISLKISMVWSIKHLPSYFPRCYRDDPDTKTCLLKAAEEVRPYLKNGVPELGFPKISPLLIPEVTLEQGTNSADYKASLRNIVVRGLENYKFREFEFSVEKITFSINCTVTDLAIEGDYVVKGKILTIPLEGQGRVQTNVSTVNATATMFGELVKEKGHTFIKVPNITVSITIGDVAYEINGLFEENEVLEKAVRNVIKENLRELIDEVTPVIESVLVEFLHKLADNSLSQVDYDELYPIRKDIKR